MANNYAVAIVSLLNSGHELDRVLQDAQRVMQTRGHQRLYGATLKMVVRMLEADEKSNEATITVATEKAETDELVKAMLNTLGANDAPVAVDLDPTLIGGAIVNYKDRQIDMSYKSALKKLYRSITTH